LSKALADIDTGRILPSSAQHCIKPTAPAARAGARRGGVPLLAIVIPLYAADVLGLDVGTIGLLVGIASAVEALLFPVAGLIMDRLGRKVAIAPRFAIQGLVMLLLPLAGGFAGLLAVAAVMGLANRLGSDVMMAVGADLAPPGSRGEFLGVWRLVGDAGGSGASLALGRPSRGGVSVVEEDESFDPIHLGTLCVGRVAFLP
jgi:MFS family permease